MGEGEVGVDPEPLELVEHRHVGRVDRLVAVDPAGRGDLDRQRRPLLERARLHGVVCERSSEPAVDEEGVLHVARGVVRPGC